MISPARAAVASRSAIVATSTGVFLSVFIADPFKDEVSL
jgi:hypothetical protein